jgi:branched-chain amino acid transport system substrate-binding protein
MRCAFIILLLASNACIALEELEIWLDVDNTNNAESAQSIILGIETALSEARYKVQGKLIKLKVKDHHGNVLRSKRNYEAYKDSPNAVVMIGGVHSPPYIKNRKYINDNKLLTMVAWAAGSPITKPRTENNWIYRVSLDDSLAGQALIDFAVNVKQCSRIGLLLEDTPWGESNKRNMAQALSSYPNTKYSVKRFGWGVSKNTMLSTLEGYKKSKTDCLVLVANAQESVKLFNALSEYKEKVPLKVISHWGVTTGNFFEQVGYSLTLKYDLSFIQTCFSFDKLPKEKAKRILSYSKSVKSCSQGCNIKAPIGFAHAYDITSILLKILSQSDLSQSASAIRYQVKNKLEMPIGFNGLVKLYEYPFTKYDPKKNIRAHEALDMTDICMGYYDQHGKIKIQDKK